MTNRARLGAQMTGKDFAASIPGLGNLTAGYIAREFDAALAAMTAERDAMSARAAVLYRFAQSVTSREGSIAQMTERAQALVDEGPVEIGERIIAEREAALEDAAFKELQRDEARGEHCSCCDVARTERDAEKARADADLADRLNVEKHRARLLGERDAARTERDAANATCESQWKELQAAKTRIADLMAGQQNDDRDHVALLAEVARLRESVAFEQEHAIEITADFATQIAGLRDEVETRTAWHERLIERLCNTLGIEDAEDIDDTVGACVQRRVEELAATKAALGRAHALLQHAGPTLSAANIDDWRRERDALLADPESRTAGEYVAALEAEHAAVAEIDTSTAGLASKLAKVLKAHAVVEALRAVKP